MSSRPPVPPPPLPGSAAASGRRGAGWRRLGAWVDDVRPATLRADALAGLLGAVLVLPQGIAFSALAGLPPAMGLVASGLPCIVAALGGSSRHVLTGPTNATALAMGAMLAGLTVSGAHATPLAPLLVPLALALTLLVGVMQLLLAGARLGAVANFVSPSVMLGFTTGAALLIGLYAVAGLLGASGRQLPWVAWQAGVSPAALWVGGVTLLAAVAGRRWWRRGPHMLAAMGLAVALAWLVERQHWPVALVSTPALLRVGDAPSAWPSLRQLPETLALLPGQLPQLLPMALALTIVALGQALSIAKALAARTGDPLDANRECLGQGLANLCAGLGGGMVVCGSLNRSLPNLEAGARTPMAAVASAVFLAAGSAVLGATASTLGRLGLVMAPLLLAMYLRKWWPQLGALYYAVPLLAALVLAAQARLDWRVLRVAPPAEAA